MRRWESEGARARGSEVRGCEGTVIIIGNDYYWATNGSIFSKIREKRINHGLTVFRIIKF